MKEIKEITVITEGFPNPENPYRYPFVEQLVREFSRKNVHVSVINPVFHNYRQYQYREEWSFKVSGGQDIAVYQPRVINFSMKSIGFLKFMNLSYRSFYSAVERVVLDKHLTPDVIYAHFAFPSGCAAVELGERIKTPSFFATGESNLAEIVNRFGPQYLRKKLAGIQGVVSVSSENSRILADNNIVDRRSIKVFPNGADQNLFYPHDKKSVRRKLGLPNDMIMGIFVGSFSDRKGVVRVNRASDIADIPMIYIGEGGLKPEGDHIAFSGGLQHDLIPEYLSAADFFVLPTKDEGCCNAIIEAICCGLPIISSNGKFNDDILEDSYSIRINPNDISQIADAMKKLSENPELRAQMSENAARQRGRFSLEKRAQAILDFMSIS